MTFISGVVFIKAFSNLIEVSPASDETRRPFMLRVFSDFVPWTVALCWYVSCWSAFLMFNCSTALGHTNVILDWASMMAKPSIDWLVLG